MMVFMRKGLPEESNRINNGQAGKIKGRGVERGGRSYHTREEVMTGNTC